jgi:pSer/pThr/pTyr-binding forkhead associated (FHA) protein
MHTTKRPSPSIARRPPGFQVMTTGVGSRLQAITAYDCCGWCGFRVDASHHYCGHCGRRTEAVRAANEECARCGHAVRVGVDLYCAACGGALSDTPPVTQPIAEGERPRGARITLLDSTGHARATYALDRGELQIGRREGDLRFADDAYLSPLHAKLIRRDGVLLLRDLGSRNGTWVFLDIDEILQDGDQLMIGSQLLQFRRLGYPGSSATDADGTRRIGSATPCPDLALLAQLRPDGSARDLFHLSRDRTVVIGRDTGDWLFPFDLTMSGRHAEIQERDGEFLARDLGSRNGVAVAVRGERPLHVGQRLLMGDQLMRIESV